MWRHIRFARKHPRALFLGFRQALGNGSATALMPGEGTDHGLLFGKNGGRACSVLIWDRQPETVVLRMGSSLPITLGADSKCLVSVHNHDL